MDPLVLLSTDSLSLAAGDSVEIAVRVRNRGEEVESYRVDVIGEVAAHAVVEPDTISVLPRGGEEQVMVRLTAPTGPAARPGTLPFGVRAVSQVDSNRSAVAEGHVDFQGAGGVNAWVPELMASGRWTGRYRVELENRGNAPVRLAVTAHDPSGELRLGVSPDAVDLLPGSPTSAKVTAKPRKPFLRGTPVSRIFQVATHDFPFGAEPPVPGMAADTEDPHHRPFQLTFEQRPILGKWVVVVAALLLLLLIALVVLWARSGSEPTFSLEKPFVPENVQIEALGSSEVEIRWEPVPNAVAYQVWPTDDEGALGQDATATEAEQASLVVGDLPAETKVCFAVNAVGFEAKGFEEDFTNNEVSARSEAKCTTTLRLPQLPTPESVSASHVGDGLVNVAWTFPEDSEGEVEQFVVFADNEQKASATPQDRAAEFTHELQEVERTLTIRVQAVGGPDIASNQSVGSELTLPAVVVTTLPPEDSDEEEENDGGDEVAGGGANGDGSGGSDSSAETTTVAPEGPASTATLPSSTTEHVPTAQPNAVFAAMVLVPNQGGVELDIVNGVLSLASGGSETRDFYNRDMFVEDSDAPEAPPSTGAAVPTDLTEDLVSGVVGDIGTAFAPGTLFRYTPALNEEQAIEFCDGVEEIGTTAQCVVKVVQSAAHPNALIRSVDERGGDTSLEDVDERLVELRQEFEGRAIHVIQGGDWEQFPDDDWIFFARVRNGEVDELCGEDEENCTRLSPIAE